MAQKKVDKRLRDWDIRVEFIKRNKEFFRNNEFVNEFGINSTNVVDLASFDFTKNIFYGFEIKSQRDNLDRLYKQLTSYTTFFNITYVVEHEKHVEATLKLIDENRHLSKVGIIKVSNSLEFEEIKKASYVKPFYDLFIRNLDLEDLRMICESKGVRSEGSKRQLVSAIKFKTNLEEIYEGLHNKIIKYHARKCPKCGSNLFYNTRKGGESTLSHCFECGEAFKVDLIADLW